MHEFAISKTILSHVKAYADANNAEKVTEVFLKIGALRGMISEWVERYFAYASKGTNIEGAKVHINVVDGSVICNSCSNIMPIDRGNTPIKCSLCGGYGLKIRSGLEFDLLSICIIQKNEERSENHA